MYFDLRLIMWSVNCRRGADAAA